MLLTVATAVAEPTPAHKTDFTGLYQSKRPDGTRQIEVVEMRTGQMGYVIRMSPTKGPIPDVTIVKRYDERLFFEANIFKNRKQGAPL